VTQVSEEDWYSERRARWEPEHVRLLLIAESAPDDGGDIANRRFFYDESLTGKDALFREVVRALYDDPPLVSGPDAKTPWLKKLKHDGVYLIDLAPVPVNYHTPLERADALQLNIEATISRAAELQPDGVVLVKQNVFGLLQNPVLEAGLSLLHDDFIPFPGSGQQKRFRERFAAALTELPGSGSMSSGGRSS
jgi:hypothetical protein